MLKWVGTWGTPKKWVFMENHKQSHDDDPVTFSPVEKKLSMVFPWRFFDAMMAPCANQLIGLREKNKGKSHMTHGKIDGFPLRFSLEKSTYAAMRHAKPHGYGAFSIAPIDHAAMICRSRPAICTAVGRRPVDPACKRR